MSARPPYLLSSFDVLQGFVSRLCDHCEAEREYRATEFDGPGQCPIFARAILSDLYAIETEHPPEIVVGEDGRGTCTAFREEEIR